MADLPGGENVYVSRAEFKELLLEMKDLKENTQEIVDWIKNGRRASHLTVRFLSWLGKFLTWCAKLALAVGTLIGLYTAVKAGKNPEMFKLFP